jgi:hypothetical protein
MAVPGEYSLMNETTIIQKRVDACLGREMTREKNPKRDLRCFLTAPKKRFEGYKRGREIMCICNNKAMASTTYRGCPYRFIIMKTLLQIRSQTPSATKESAELQNRQSRHVSFCLPYVGLIDSKTSNFLRLSSRPAVLMTCSPCLVS